MPDTRAVNALSQAWNSQREQLQMRLRDAGYKPDELDELPDPGDCTCELATAIRRWREVNDRLEDATRRTHGGRY